MRKSSAVAAQHAVLDPSTIAGLYGMVITGSCMVPTYPDGAIARVCPEEPYKKGDVVVAWIRPEFRKPGSPPALIKRIVMMPPPYVTFPFRDGSLRAAFDSRKLWLRVQLWRARRMFDRADRLKERGNRIPG